MKVEKLLKKGIIVLTVVAVSMSFTDTKKVLSETTKEIKKEYIVCTKRNEKIKKIEKEFHPTEKVNANTGGNLQENNMTAIELTERDAKELSERKGVEFVEEDIYVKER